MIFGSSKKLFAAIHQRKVKCHFLLTQWEAFIFRSLPKLLLKWKSYKYIAFTKKKPVTPIIITIYTQVYNIWIVFSHVLSVVYTLPYLIHYSMCYNSILLALMMKTINRCKSVLLLALNYVLKGVNQNIFMYWQDCFLIHE